MQVNRVGDEVGVAANQILESPTGGELFLVGTQMERNRRARRGAAAFVHRVFAIACAHPLDRRLTFTTAQGFHRHAIGDHECCVEANAKLADEFGDIRFLAVLQSLCKGLRTALCNRAQRFFSLLGAHADTVIFNRQRMRHRICRQTNRPLRGFRGNRCIGQCQILCTVNCVTRIRDQFTQKDFFFRIKRMNH